MSLRSQPPGQPSTPAAAAPAAATPAAATGAPTQPPSAFHRSRDLFLRAVELHPDRRSAFLEAQSADDSIRLEVEELLRLHDSGGEFLERSAIESLSDAELMDDLPAGEMVAGFTIVSVLGRGGMGVVYRARQESPDRDVAVKLIRPGLLSRETVRRFAQEAAALARLQHPGIAQVFQAGTTAVRGSPRPYLAMELVEGASIAVFADSQALDTRARIKLFTRACDAVHHAHVRGVVHRDLKPANIIVDQSGAPPLPRILDFGIARLAERTETQTKSTLVGQVVGTLAYMSPEQAAGDPEGVDSRADVYSLGVVLYELLCHALPIEVGALPLADALRAAAEKTPIRPSARNPEIKGDLEAIILHALEKDPSRRYQHASTLADDLRRYLRDEPITARPATAFYSIRKFARRNRVLVAAAVFIVLTLIAAVAVTGTALVRANAATATSERINQYLRGLLQLDPAVIRNRDMTALRLLLDSAREKTGVLEEDPVAKAAVEAILGNAYWEFGYPAEARPLLEQAYPILRARAGESHDDTLFAMDALAILRMNDREYASAEGLWRESMALRRAKEGDDSRLAFIAQGNLVMLLQRDARLDEALAAADDLVARRTAVSGVGSRDAARALNVRAGALLRLFRFEEAAALLPGVIETLTAANGLDHPDTLSARAYFVSALRDSEREQEALEESLGLVETLINSNGPDHPRTIEGQMQLFPLLVSGGRDEDADALLTDLIERFPRVMGKDHVNIMSLYGNGAQVATALGDHERANELSAFAERKARTMLPEKHPALGPMLMIRASTLRNLGLTRDEMTVLEEAFFQFTTIEPKDLGRAARAARQLAGAARQLDDPEAADRWGAEADRLDGR